MTSVRASSRWISRSVTWDLVLRAGSTAHGQGRSVPKRFSMNVAVLTHNAHFSIRCAMAIMQQYCLLMQILVKDLCYGCSKTDSQSTFYNKMCDNTDAQLPYDIHIYKYQQCINYIEMFNLISKFVLGFFLQCFPSCGSGHRSRQVYCSAPDGSQISEAKCQSKKPKQKKACRNKRPCGGYWFAGPWSEVRSNQREVTP